MFVCLISRQGQSNVRHKLGLRIYKYIHTNNSFLKREKNGKIRWNFCNSFLYEKFSILLLFRMHKLHTFRYQYQMNGREYMQYGIAVYAFGVTKLENMTENQIFTCVCVVKTWVTSNFFFLEKKNQIHRNEIYLLDVSSVQFFLFLSLLFSSSMCLFSLWVPYLWKYFFEICQSIVCRCHKIHIRALQSTANKEGKKNYDNDNNNSYFSHPQQ